MSKNQNQREAKPKLQSSGLKPQNRNLLVLFLLGFLLYANTIPFKYTLDDKLAITANTFTKKGFGGIKDHLTHEMFFGFFGKQKNLVEGGRYRPLSMVTFAIEWGLFGENPHISHLVNALLYGFTAMLLYLVLLQLFPAGKNQKWFLTLPVIITALYIAHPLHTEAVANIKGRDEIMSLLGALGALYFLLKYLDEKKLLLLLWSGLCFFLGLCSKESAITFVGVATVTLLFFPRGTMKENLVSLIPMVAATFIYMTIRGIVLGDIVKGQIAQELMNDPFLKAEAGQKIPTILYTMLIYVKLLIFPHPLTHDYYPWYPIAQETYKWGAPFPYLNWSSPKAIAGLLIYLALIVYGIIGLIKAIQKKEKSVIAYGILIYLGTFILFSNLFITIGSFMNERFMFIPSLGFAIIFGYTICPYTPRLFGKSKKAKSETDMKIIFMVLLLAYSAKTFSRNFAWKDDYSLSMTDVKISSTSAKVLMSAGGALVDKAIEMKNPAEKEQNLKQAAAYLGRSLELYPAFIPSLLLSGNAYTSLGQYDNGIMFYENCLRIDSVYTYAVHNLLMIGDTCTKLGKYDSAIKSLLTLTKYNTMNVQAYQQLGELYGKNLRDFQKSEEYLNKALTIEPKNTNTLQKLGVLNAMQGRMQKALEIFTKADELEPNSPQIMMNLGITYFNLGDTVKGKSFIQKAEQIDPSIKK